MTYRLKNHSLLLAALLQLLPFVKTVLTHPAAASTWAIVFRWAVGSTAAVGAFDSVSGATSVFTTPSAFSGTVGTPFNASVNVSIGGGNTAASSDYIVLSSGTITSPLLGSGQSTSVTLPPGLTFTASWVNGSVNIGGSISGTPTAAGTYPTTVLIVSPGNAALSQNITITITGSSGPVAPGITAPPVGTNVIAGHNAVFKVTATGTAPLNYAWSKNNSPLADGGNISGSATATLTVASVSAADAGNYTVTVTNTAGKATSTSAALGVIIPPSLTTPPQAVAATAGGNASFSVVATGSAPLNYFWLKNGSALASSAKISGVNTATLGLTGIATTDAGNYSVIVSNTAGSVTSSPAALTIVTSPTISVQPIGRTVATGANVSFAIAAAGSTPLFYFWQKNGQPLADGGNISGSSTTNLNLSAATVNDAGTYSVIVSNALGSATSSNAALAVLIPAGIVTAPVAATVNVGGSTTFTVLASGSTPLNYQWSKNNVNLSGANHATLSLANISANDAGNYSVTVSNAVGGAASSAASLTVLSPPTILSQPVNTTVSLGANAAFTANVTGTAPLHLQWFKNSQPLADGGNISGSSTTNLNLAAVTSSDAGNYSLTIVNAAGSTNSSASSLTVIVPPAIVTPPAPVTAVAGTNISFTVAANGTAPFTFQWQKNGVNLSAANTDTLSLANIGLGNAGNYSVVVGNAAGSITSAVATLTVLLPPAITTQPANQDGPPGNSVTLTVVATGSAPLTYQWFKGSNALADGGNISGANTSALTISSLSTNDVDIYFVVVSNFLGLATSAGASVTVSSAPFILVQPASQIATRSNTVALNVTATGSGTLFYQWRKNGTALANSGGVSGVNTFTLTLANATTNLNGNYSVSITNTFGSVTSSIATLAVYAPPQIVASPTNRTAIVGSNVVFAATVTGTAPLNFQWFKDGIALADGGNISGATTNVLKISNLTPNDEASYSLAVTNPVGNTTSASAALTVLVPPTIITQPVAQSVVASNAVTFSVEANGTAPLRFQWRKAGAAIAGATNANLIIASAKTNDAANYSVIVTNLAGSVTSSNAALTVFTMPVFTLQATNRGAKLASTTIFRAAVSGTLPMNYQWFKNGSALADGGNISGSASNVLTVANVTTNDAGAYSLTATNLAGSVTSSNALLKIFLPPVILQQPVDLAVVISNSVTFSVLADGSPRPRYQWRKAGVAIANATNASFTIAAVRTNDAAVYSVLVTNFVGSVVSSNAALTVLLPPVFTLQSSNRTVTAPAFTVFAAAVKGTAPFSYQWLKDGTPLADDGNISGSLSNVLTIALVTVNDAGAYSLAVTNAAGGIISSNAVLVVRTPTRGGGDDGNDFSENSIHHLANKTVAVSAKISTAAIPARPIAQIKLNATGGITLDFTGTANTSYIVQSSVDLLSWKNIFTNTADAQGVWSVTDTLTAPMKFYRLQTQ